MTFHQRGCPIRDPDASEFLGVEKLTFFSLIRRKQKLTRTVTFICWRLPECRRLYPGNDFEFLQDSAPSHRAKVTQQFLRQNTPDFIAADEWASCSPDLNPLDYCILGYPAGFGVRRPTTSVCKSTGPQRGNQKQTEGGHHWDSSKIHCTMENDRMRLESRMEARFSTFSANRCAVRCVELIGYIVRFGNPILFCVFHCQNKSV